MANFIDRGFIWSSLLLVCLAAVTVLGQDWYGPQFVRQPPLSVTFGNNTGTVLTCQVTGQPVPQVSWRDRYGAPLPDVLDLRSTLDNGSLWFHPFPASNYRQDVHTASVQCHVTNVHGTVVSRQVKVNAVVSQPYDVTLNDVTAGRGSTAVVWCRVSSYANGYVKVTSWRFGDLHLAVGHRSDKLATWRDLMLIRDVTEQDENVAIRCETMDTLSDAARLSSTAYLHLHDIGRSTTSAGGLFHSLPVDVEAHAGQDVALYCPVLDTPAASVSWYHQVRDLMTPLYHSGHVAVGRDLIRLRRVRADDSGIYRCSHLPPTSNDAASGVSSHDFRLQVTSPVRVEILPTRSLVHVNQATRLTCHVQPESLQTDVIWLRNGQRISAADGLTSLTLPVNDPTVAGMYQCHVTEDVATAEVRLAVWPPRMSTTLVDHTVQPGSAVSLTCSASGPPRPDLGWYSNGQVIPASRTGHRRRVKTTVSESGDVTSQLTISPVSVRDAGSYRCLARNQAGEVYDTAQLHVYGSAAALPRRSLTLAAGSSVVLDCPVSGYPLSEFAWRLDGVDLSRQLLANGSLRVEELQTGEYSCRATGGDGTRITGFIHVNVLVGISQSAFVPGENVRACRRQTGNAELECRSVDETCRRLACGQEQYCGLDVDFNTVHCIQQQPDDFQMCASAEIMLECPAGTALRAYLAGCVLCQEFQQTVEEPEFQRVDHQQPAPPPPPPLRGLGEISVAQGLLPRLPELPASLQVRSGSFPQPSAPPVFGQAKSVSFPQPPAPPVRGSFPQPPAPPVRGSFPQPPAPPVRGSFPQPPAPLVRGSFPQPPAPPVRGSFPQPPAPPSFDGRACVVRHLGRGAFKHECQDISELCKQAACPSSSVCALDLDEQVQCLKTSVRDFQNCRSEQFRLDQPCPADAGVQAFGQGCTFCFGANPFP